MKYHGDARMIDCPGVTSDGLAGHAERDGCWSCAPFWERIPICPIGHRVTDTTLLNNLKQIYPKLSETGYCKRCRKHYRIGR